MQSFQRCDFFYSRPGAANFARADLRGANIQRAIFRAADLRGANLDDAHGAVTQAMIEGKPLEPVMMAYRQLAAKADKDFRRLNELTGWYA